MNLTFDAVKKIIDSDYHNYEGEAMMWFQLVWSFAERNNLNSFSTYAEKIQAYSFIYGMYLIYQKFTAKQFEYDECSISELDFDYGMLIDSSCYDEELQDEMGDIAEKLLVSYLKGIIESEENILTVFRVLQKELGLSKTFALLYYCLNFSHFSLEEWENDDFYYGDIDNKELENAIASNQDYEQRKLYASYDGIDEVFDKILNNVNASKLICFEWLSNYLN